MHGGMEYERRLYASICTSHSHPQAEQDHLEEKVKVAERKKDAAESAKIRANKGVMGDDD